MATNAPRRKPGRVPKGVREQVPLRVPSELKPILQAAAADAGVSSLSQYLADRLCLDHGRPDLARELHTQNAQGVLPLTG